jgi:membrane associated rhomboid family serine protease
MTTRPIALPVLAAIVFSACAFDAPGKSAAFVVDHACNMTGLRMTAGRALRSLFIHASWSHLASNCIALSVLGSLLEYVHGAPRAVAIFFLGGILGVFGWASYQDAAAQYVGASPGVYAVGAAFGAHLLLNWDETPGRVLWAVHLLGVAALDVWSYAAMHDERIAYASHVAGAFVGLFAGLALLQNTVRRQWEVVLEPLGAGGVLLFGILASRAAVCD